MDSAQPDVHARELPITTESFPTNSFPTSYPLGVPILPVAPSPLIDREVGGTNN